MQRHRHRLSLSYRAHHTVPQHLLWAYPSSSSSEQGNDLLQPCVERVRSLLCRRSSDGVSSVRPREEYVSVCLPMRNSVHEAQDGEGLQEGLLDLTLEGLFPANQTLVVNPAKRTATLLSHTPGLLPDQWKRLPGMGDIPSEIDLTTHEGWERYNPQSDQIPWDEDVSASFFVSRASVYLNKSLLTTPRLLIHRVLVHSMPVTVRLLVPISTRSTLRASSCFPQIKMRQRFLRTVCTLSKMSMVPHM